MIWVSLQRDIEGYKNQSSNLILPKSQSLPVTKRLNPNSVLFKVNQNSLNPSVCCQEKFSINLSFMLASKPCFLHTFSSDTRFIFIVKVTLKIWNKSTLKMRFCFRLQRPIVPRYDSIVARFFQWLASGSCSTIVAHCFWIVARFLQNLILS